MACGVGWLAAANGFCTEMQVQRASGSPAPTPAGGTPAVRARQSGQVWAGVTGLPWASSVMDSGAPLAQITSVWPNAIWPRAIALVSDVTSIVRHRQSVSRGFTVRMVSGIASDTQPRKWAIYHAPVHIGVQGRELQACGSRLETTKKPRAVAGRGLKFRAARPIRQRRLSRLLS